LSDREDEVVEIVGRLIEEYRKEKGTIIGLLQDINEKFRYLPEEAILMVSRELNIPVAKLYTLATFYKSFRLDPVGKLRCVWEQPVTFSGRRRYLRAWKESLTLKPDRLPVINGLPLKQSTVSVLVLSDRSWLSTESITVK